MEGIICINKPPKYTSFDVIARLRGMSKVKRVGHSGTLDPMATGVLPVFFGKATKACDLMPDDKKEYVAEFIFGYKSDTLDSYGDVQLVEKTNVSLQQIESVLPEFIGNIMQIPPMYSAVRVNGQRLYDIARQGLEIKREERPVTIHGITLLNFDEELQTGKLKILCSKGTYVRTLCADIGEKLNCSCIMGELVRTLSNGYTLDKCITLEQAQELTNQGLLQTVLQPINTVFSHLPKIVLSPKQAQMMLNGVVLDLNRIKYEKTHDMYAVYDVEGRFLALAREDLEDEGLMIIKRFA